MKKLKECPFCGGKVDWCKDDPDTHQVTDDCHYINCERCGEFSLHIPDFVEFPEVYEVIADQWNTRTSIPISKLEELIKNCNTTYCDGYSHGDMISVKDLQKLIDGEK